MNNESIEIKQSQEQYKQICERLGVVGFTQNFYDDGTMILTTAVIDDEYQDSNHHVIITFDKLKINDSTDDSEVNVTCDINISEVNEHDGTQKTIDSVDDEKKIRYELFARKFISDWISEMVTLGLDEIEANHIKKQKILAPEKKLII